MKNTDHQKNAEALFGKTAAALIEDDHICVRWKFPEGITGVYFETTKENRRALYNLICNALKQYEAKVDDI